MQTFPNINAGMPSTTHYGPLTEIPAPQPGQSILVAPLGPNNLGSNVQWGEQRVLYQPTVQLPPGVILPDGTLG